MRERYRGRGREGRSRLIDELCEMCGYERKHAIKLLNGKRPITGEARRRGEHKRYCRGPGQPGEAVDQNRRSGHDRFGKPENAFHMGA